MRAMSAFATETMGGEGLPLDLGLYAGSDSTKRPESQPKSLQQRPSHPVPS